MAIRVLYPMFGNTMGGSHLSTLQLIDNLSTHIEPIISLHHCTGLLAKHVQNFENVSYIFCPQSLRDILKRPFRYLQAVLAARDFIKTHKIDIVQCDDGVVRHIWFYAAKMAGAKYIHVQHTLVNVNFEKNFLYPKFDACVVCSEVVANTMPLKTTPIVAYPCIDFIPKANTHKKNQVLFLANMRQQKRPLVFLETARKYLDKHPKSDTQFIMSGDFYDDMEVRVHQFITQHSLQNHVQIQNFTDDVATLLGQTKVLIVPAIGDSFGRTLIEAMASNTAVIAAYSGGHIDIITDRDDGIFVKPDNVCEYVEALDELMNKEFLYHKIVERGLETSKKFLHTNRSVSIFESLYEDVSVKS